jgi:DNA-3-methyladenine glycosylase II
MVLFTSAGTLAPVAPFTFARTLDFLRDFPPLRDEVVAGRDGLSMVLSAGGQPVAVDLRASGSPHRRTLSYHLVSRHPISEYTVSTVGNRLRFFLSLDDDLRFFYELGRRDAHFSRLVSHLYGYHHVKFPSCFEGAVWALLAQHNTMAGAQRSKQALIEAYGARLAVHDRTLRAFPEPSRLTAASGRLAAVVGGERRAARVRAAARAFAAVDCAFLRESPYAEVESWLRSIDGIGPWSARFVLIRGLGRMEKVPADDLLLARATTIAYQMRRPATSEDVARLARRYGPWQGYWAHYLMAGLLAGHGGEVAPGRAGRHRAA